MENEVRQRKPIPFSWRLERKWCRNGVWGVFGSISVEREMGKTMNSHKFEGKTEKVLKTVFEMQNTRFSRLKQVAIKSPGQAAKTLKDKIVKIFLSVFCDWKVYPRGSRELSRENLFVPLATRPFTREQVAKINTRACGYSMRLGWPAIVSPKQGNTIFEIFQFLWKQSTFQKHLKHSKIFLCLNQQRLSMWKHILTSTITQMNMAFIEHKLVCCVWISAMR